MHTRTRDPKDIPWIRVHREGRPVGMLGEGRRAEGGRGVTGRLTQKPVWPGSMEKSLVLCLLSEAKVVV
jgi:hypothetical protein